MTERRKNLSSLTTAPHLTHIKKGKCVFLELKVTTYSHWINCLEQKKSDNAKEHSLKSPHEQWFRPPSTGSWVQVGSDIDGRNEDDWSGCSVAMSEDGSRVVVGCSIDNDAGTTDGNNSGHVRVSTTTPSLFV